MPDESLGEWSGAEGESNLLWYRWFSDLGPVEAASVVVRHEEGVDTERGRRRRHKVMKPGALAMKTESRKC
ncbi:hypothetical protein NDU88_003599 [Pleurodeles waltl]|uniref:Uncharacterized protein n=1 Tax=Pleurodeles waltl TaxID=8319 RepID=A0AAV7V1X0_PLEWA|nr:hypothetical protein NDU88_003599 [Pleurodeles waltl]